MSDKQNDLHLLNEERDELEIEMIVIKDQLGMTQTGKVKPQRYHEDKEWARKALFALRMKSARFNKVCRLIGAINKEIKKERIAENDARNRDAFEVFFDLCRRDMTKEQFEPLIKEARAIVDRQIAVD